MLYDSIYIDFTSTEKERNCLRLDTSCITLYFLQEVEDELDTTTALRELPFSRVQQYT